MLWLPCFTPQPPCIVPQYLLNYNQDMDRLRQLLQDGSEQR